MANGRPLKITKKVIDTICEAIQIGTPFSHAAVYGGISYRTFLYWMQIGREEAERLAVSLEQGEDQEPDPTKESFLHFFRKVEEAKSYAIVGWVNTINEHATGRSDPNWARYMLSKHSSETYGEQAQKIELTGKDGGPVAFDINPMLKKVWGLETPPAQVQVDADNSD